MPNLARALVVGTMAAGALLPMVPAEGLAAYFLIAFPPFGIIMIALLVPFYWVLAQAVVRVFNRFVGWLQPASIHAVVFAAIAGHIGGGLVAMVTASVVDHALRTFAPHLIGPLAATPRGDEWYMVPILLGVPPLGTLGGALAAIFVKQALAPPSLGESS